jgi:transglutaminase-like putative cysteine protease
MKQDLYLLHGETILKLRSNKDVNSFKVTHVIPLNYEEQAPIFFEVKNTSSAEIISYQITDDIHPPNKVVNFIISPLKTNKIVHIHFEYWVIIKNKKYHDIPPYVRISSDSNLPDHLKTWLSSTESVQSNNIFIRLRAFRFRFFDKNLINVTKKILYYIAFHRFFLQLLRLILEINPYLRPIFLRKRYYTGLMDAVSCFFLGSLCAGQINLAVALMRANKIPTRILIGTMFGMVFFAGENVWLDSQHYMMEFYCPGYGWIKCTPGKFAHQPKNYIISRVVYPEDENVAGNGFSYYGGMVPWFWIENENIDLAFPDEILTIYKKPYGNVSGVPATRFNTLKKISSDYKQSNIAFELTKNIWEAFTKLQGLILDNENKRRYNEAIQKHKKALRSFKNSDLDEYTKNLKLALSNYQNIKI